MKGSFFILFVLCFGQIILAQNTYAPTDTAYSIHSSYLKISKKQPNVKPVWANLPKQVEAFSNVVYLELENGRKLHLDVFKPKRRKHKKRPAILMIHGGGWMTGSKENLIPMAQQLAKKGFVTVTVEYRLGGESSYPSAVYDLKSAVRWLRANAEIYNIDTNKIAAYGCSAGAHLATLLGTTNNNSHFDKPTQNAEYSANVQAILNIDGIVSFIHQEAKPEWSGRSANAWLGDYNDNFERWKSASPLEYVDKNTPPILFINSSKPRFHAGRDDFIAIIDQHNIYHKTHTFENSPHAFWLLEPWFEPTLKYSLRFLKKVF
ncbi:MAG: alpha/beta hydrolase fold domain-containing protein [Saprospiraceae bacterium]